MIFSGQRQTMGKLRLSLKREREVPYDQQKQIIPNGKHQHYQSSLSILRIDQHINFTMLRHGSIMENRWLSVTYH